MITICDTDSPPAYPVMLHMNFKSEILSKVLCNLNWSTIQVDYKSGECIDFHSTSLFLDTPSAMAVPAMSEIRSDKHSSRITKRNALSSELMKAREDLFAGEFDAFVISSSGPSTSLN